MSDIPHTVMIVDDDWMLREIMQVHLENEGYRVLTAHSGEKALELAATHAPDLVILDIRMQGMSGHEVCARLKAADNTRHTAIIMTTALNDDGSQREAVAAGADDFLAKPFDAIVMLTRVRSLLRIKSLHDELERRDQVLWEVLARYVDSETARLILADMAESRSR